MYNVRNMCSILILLVTCVILLIAGVFCANSLNINTYTSVAFSPIYKFTIETSTDNGTTYTTVFDNRAGYPQVYNVGGSSYENMTLPVTIGASKSTALIFRVTNYTINTNLAFDFKSINSTSGNATFTGEDIFVYYFNELYQENEISARVSANLNITSTTSEIVSLVFGVSPFELIRVGVNGIADNGYVNLSYYSKTYEHLNNLLSLYFDVEGCDVEWYTNEALTTPMPTGNVVIPNGTNIYNKVYWNGQTSVPATFSLSLVNSQQANSPENPYQICTGYHLAYLDYIVDNNLQEEGTYYKIMFDLYLNNGTFSNSAGTYYYTPKGGTAIVVDSLTASNIHTYNPIGYFNSNEDNKAFAGIMIGNNKNIYGLYINNTETSYAGLFAVMGGSLDRCNMRNYYIKGGNSVGAFCGYSAGIFQYCNAYGSVLGNEFVGSIVGKTTNATSYVTNCENNGTVVGSRCTGGLVGLNGSSAHIENSTNRGNVTGVNGTGGITGQNDGTINTCHNYYSLALTSGLNLGGIAGVQSPGASTTSCINYASSTSGVSQVGGICGQNIGNITSCENKSIINATADLCGGVSAINQAGVINLCTNNGTVNGVNGSGGLAGFNSDTGGMISNSTNNANVNGASVIGGVCAENHIAINNCKNYGTITSTSNISGGVVGYNQGQYVQLLNSTNYGNVTGIAVTAGVAAFNGGYTQYCANHGNITGNGNFVGGIAGRQMFATATLNSVYEGTDDAWGEVYDCYNTGAISMTGNYEYIGGLIGYKMKGIVANSYNTGTVNGYRSVGGIAGFAEGVTANCYNLGAITGGFLFVGGIIGYLSYAEGVTNCYNKGSVTALGASTQLVGGIVGIASPGNLYNCYNTGVITGTDFVGGIAGGFDSSGMPTTMTNCYNMGNVHSNGQLAGGICSYTIAGTITNCYNTGSISAVNYAFGMIGCMNGTITINNSYSTNTASSNDYSVFAYVDFGATSISSNITNSNNLGDSYNLLTQAVNGSTNITTALNTFVSANPTISDATPGAYGGSGHSVNLKTFATLTVNNVLQTPVHKGSGLAVYKGSGTVSAIYSNEANTNTNPLTNNTHYYSRGNFVYINYTSTNVSYTRVVYA